MNRGLKHGLKQGAEECFREGSFFRGRYRRITLLPLTRRIRLRISNTLIVARTRCTGKPQDSTTRSMLIGSLGMAFSTCSSNSFNFNSAG